MNRKKVQTLSDKISNVLNTTPGIIDPEDDIYEDTTAKVVLNEENEDEDQTILTKQSKLQKQNLELLENVDNRYAGKRRTRKISDESDFSEQSASEKNNSENDLDTSDENENSLNESSVDEQSDVESEAEEEYDTKFKHIKEVNINNQVQKGNSVKNQLCMWENLLEVRIKLQKCLLTANKLPQKETYFKIKEKSGNEFNNRVKETQTGIKHVLNGLLNLQEMLISKYPETKNLGENTEKVEDSDEEIPSDSDEENEKMTDGIDNEDDRPVAKKAKTFHDYEQTISSRHTEYTSYRNNVIKKWNEKTRISVSKNLINSNSVINQIEYILKDREKYLKKTQLKRSNYSIVGLKAANSLPDNKRSFEEYNSEIFDDDDFYHQLLRELIEYKSSNVTDPVKLSRQWIQLQSMRSKMKRNIDTKATKGRKIRYTVHTKLINFLAPMGGNEWTESATNELYSSLFGKNLGK